MNLKPRENKYPLEQNKTKNTTKTKAQKSFGSKFKWRTRANLENKNTSKKGGERENECVFQVLRFFIWLGPGIIKTVS